MCSQIKAVWIQPWKTAFPELSWYSGEQWRAGPRPARPDFLRSLFVPVQIVVVCVPKLKLYGFRPENPRFPDSHGILENIGAFPLIQMALNFLRS
jgi:hypothetical protein